MRLVRSELVKHNGQRGIVILLVAVVLLFVVGAMAALSIDVVTFYTARSEAQLAADAAALAGARVLANSGFTSTSAIPTAAVKTLATNVANQVAASSNVAGRILNLSEITVTYPNEGAPAFATNPQVNVNVTRTDIPTFFARIWGRTTVTVQAHATAEAYNPSGASALTGGTVIPVAPTCVKPWVLPNLTPSPGGGAIFDAVSGAIVDTALVGEDPTPAPLEPICTTGNCAGGWWPATPQPWKFYPGTTTGALPSFPPPTALPACAANLDAYQQSVAGCVETPIACGSTVNLETSHPQLHQDTAKAVDCLTNGSGSQGDYIDPNFGPALGLPFQFQAGADNPLVQVGIAQGTDVMVSESIVTVPVYASAGTAPGTTVTVIGFVQLFLNPLGAATPGNAKIPTTVLNIAGCGTAVSPVQPILGNGASPVPVRLITQP